MQRSRSLYFRFFYVIMNIKRNIEEGEKDVFVVCWQNLKKGVLFQYLTLTIKRGLCKQSPLMRCYSIIPMTQTSYRPFNNPYNNTWRQRSQMHFHSMNWRPSEGLFPSRDETRADWEVSEEFRGPARLRCHRSQSPGSDKLDKDRRREGTGARTATNISSKWAPKYSQYWA